MNFRLLLLIACFAAVVTPARAQRLTIEFDGGLQGTQFRLPAGSTRPLPGGSLGLLYAFPLQDHVNFLTGITVGIYRTQARLLDGTTFKYYQVDDEGSAFQYNMRTEGYKETQQFIAAAVPLLLQYHTGIGRMQWYVDGGAKLLFPTSDRIDITADQLNLSGYYPDYNITLSDLPKHGFGTINGWKTTTSTSLRPAAALSASSGIGFPLPHGMQIYAGLYVDYGLSGLKSRNDSMPLFTYSPGGISGTEGNGVLNLPNTGRMNLLAFGLQLRLSLGSGNSRATAHAGRNKEARQLAPAAPVATNPTQAPTTVPANPTQAPTTVPANPTQAPAPVAGNSPELDANDWKVMQAPVLFGTLDEISLSDIAKSHLDEVADIMLRNPGLRISITGHICNSGTARESIKIGETRAKAVAAYLRRKGIDRKRMDVGYETESDPVVPDNPAKNYLRRRVVMAIK